jgi:uncharacterized membrane protein
MTGEAGPDGALAEAAAWIAAGLEAAGVAAVLVGALVTTFVFLREGLGGGEWRSGYGHYRADLGRAILLGLELLVAADIVATVTAPLTIESLTALGLVVLIRTFLSLSLEVEIHGHWPWQRRRRREGGDRDSTGR